MLRVFGGLRGQLILTYTLVTVLALLALEVLVLGGLAAAGFVVLALDNDRGGYFSDVVSTLAPQARAFLQPGAQDLPGLQAWLDEVRALGQASLPPQYLGDSPAALLAPGQPLYVLAPDGLVLAQSPLEPGSLVGQPYAPLSPAEAEALALAQRGVLFNSGLSVRTAAGHYVMVVPVPQQYGSPVLAGLIVLTVTPPPNSWAWVWPAVTELAPRAALTVSVTGVLLLLAVAPLGALFGLIMSRPLTRRLAALSAAAEAWSAGDFSRAPHDRAADEIGHLSRRLRHMAERIQALLQTQQALAALQERNRLARDLHDTVKQQSFATLMQVRAARHRLAAPAPDPAAAGSHLAAAEDLLKTSQEELSRLLAELPPAALEGQGLAAAVRAHVQAWSTHSRILAEVAVHGERPLPLEVEKALYRVVQEALANVARHSHASAVRLGLDYAAGALSLRISDNGLGFDHDAAPQGFGLPGMRQRLADLGGALEVTSGPDGTTITGRLPL